MQPIRYIHAADLHLDRPFSGMSTADAKLLPRLRESSFLTLRRLGALCESEKPDFLVLAGDIYDQEEHSIKAQLALLDLCHKLAGLDIPVFIAHGNHDPLSSLIHSLNWPENVTIFSDKVSICPVYRNGEKIALIHGISHAQSPESANLAKQFHRDPDFNGFQLGILHCALDVISDDARYAPCSIDDLKNSGLDAWALGHSHDRRILCAEPFIAYSGSAQGFRINESGPKGCLSVTAENTDDLWRCQAEDRQLAAIQWEKVTVDMSGLDKIDDAENRIFSSLDKLQSEAAPGINEILVRIILTGRTSLNALLRLNSTIFALRDRLASLENCHPAIYIKDFVVETKALLAADLSGREDLLGEIWREADKLEQNQEELAKFSDKVFNPLFSNALARKYLRSCDAVRQKELLQQAKLLCQEYLEQN